MSGTAGEPTTESRQHLRWTWVIVAALAMAATLPGRTHGLGLITEPVMAELNLSRVDYGLINLWATLLGALFCLPCGWLADRCGIRPVMVGVVALLGGIVLLMSVLPSQPVLIPLVGFDFFLLVLLTRGLGQSALSVVSLALIGRTAGRKGNAAMAGYSMLVTLFFMGAFGLAKLALEYWHAEWRTLWAGIGLVLLLGVVPISWLWGPAREPTPNGLASPDPSDGSTLGAALRTSAFWIFALSTSLYGLIASGISLFNQSILAERGFDRSVFLNITVISPLVGLTGNLITGWLASHFGLNRLLTLSMLVLATALTVFPWVQTETEVYAYAVALGFAGGMVTVIFFAVWSRLFGVTHLGRIQGAAQMLTVIASAVGPLLMAVSKEQSGSYVPLFRILGAASVVLALAAWRIRT